jgi:hypothetical protein
VSEPRPAVHEGGNQIPNEGRFSLFGRGDDHHSRVTRLPAFYAPCNRRDRTGEALSQRKYLDRFELASFIDSELAVRLATNALDLNLLIDFFFENPGLPIVDAAIISHPKYSSTGPRNAGLVSLAQHILTSVPASRDATPIAPLSL